MDIIRSSIYKIIKEKMMVQAEVGRRAGYTAKSFNNMLCGRKAIYAEDIKRICDVLGVTPNELYGIDESE